MDQGLGSEIGVVAASQLWTGTSARAPERLWGIWWGSLTPLLHTPLLCLRFCFFWEAQREWRADMAISTCVHYFLKFEGREDCSNFMGVDVETSGNRRLKPLYVAQFMLVKILEAASEFINGWMDKENVMFLYTHGALLCCKAGWTWILRKADAPGGHSECPVK